MAEEKNKLTEQELTKKIEKASQHIKTLLKNINDTHDYIMQLSGIPSFVLKPSDAEKFGHVALKIAEHEQLKAIANYANQIKNILADLADDIPKPLILQKPPAGLKVN